MARNAAIAKASAMALATVLLLGTKPNANAITPAPEPMHIGCVLHANARRNLDIYVNYHISELNASYASDVKRIDIQEADDIAAELHPRLKALIRSVREAEKGHIYAVRFFELNDMELLKSEIQVRFTCGTTYGSTPSLEWAKISRRAEKIEDRADSKVKQIEQVSNQRISNIYSDES